MNVLQRTLWPSAIARSTYAAALFAAIVALLLYLPALQNGFVNWDDEAYVVDNQFIRALDSTLVRAAFAQFTSANWHPLTWISHALDYALWGQDPLGHHLTSIVLHAINSALAVLLVAGLCSVARAATSAGPRVSGALEGRGVLSVAITAGLLFAVHPIHVESVAWVSERKDVLYALFYLLALISYLRYATADRPGEHRDLLLSLSVRRYLVVLAFFALSLMSKPMAITLPAVLIILDWYPLGRMQSAGTLKPLLIEKVPFLALSLLSAAITLQAQSSGWAVNSNPFLDRLFVGMKAPVAYIGKILCPSDLLPFYPYPQKIDLLSPAFLAPVLLTVGITAACVIAAKKHRLWLVAWASYVIMLLPVLGIVQVGEQAMADRYMYLPSLALFLLAGVGASFLQQRLSMLARWRMPVNALKALLIFSVLGALSVATYRQILVWRDSISLWTHVIEGAPDIAKPYHYRGNVHRVGGRYEEALRDFTEAIRLNRHNANYFNDRGIVYAKLRRFPEAIADFSMALLIQPAKAVYFRNRGNAYGEAGWHEEARQDFLRADIIDSAGTAR